MNRGSLKLEKPSPTLGGLLRARAAERPERVAFTFLAEGEAEGESLTYGELDRRAGAIASALAESVPPGERALLLYPPGLDFIAAFFGCLYAGVVAVPAYPPRPNDRSQSRLRAIVGDAAPRVALTTAAIASVAETTKTPELAGLRWLPTDGLNAPGPEILDEPDPESVAFLQYTSGSTATPKGVMVTHANLLHNEAMIGAAFGMDEHSVVVGWLPLYHDMGLIGNVLQPLHAGARCVLMPPVAFLQRPMRWLEAIDRHRGTVSGGPNFAYELCLRRATPEALAGLDLSSWRVAFNGAEPVRAATLARFAAAFAPCGFRREAFYPCYGLAEATLFVAGGAPGEAPRVDGATGRVSCGRPWMGQRLVVADPETGSEVLPGGEGEIWLAGPSVARGYWRNEEATERDFNAFLMISAGSAGVEGPFLRTGDLGIVSGDGELYVTGRLKDLIILRGRNLYPQDVELTAEGSHGDLRPGGGAAFSVEIEGEERLVVVHEVERRWRDGIERIAEAVRRAVAAEHEAQVYEVVLIRQGALPKTSSGKVQRRRCRDLYLRGELVVEGRSALARGEAAPEMAAAPAGELTREGLAGYLRERAAAVLGLPASAIGAQPLTALGLDSLTAVELKGSVEAALGVAVPLADLLQGIGVEELAERLAAGSAAGPSEIPVPRVLALEGDQSLSAGQRGLWFLERLAPDGGAYNIAAAARTEGLDPAAFARAVGALADRHEALRTVFPVVDDEPVQRVLPALAPNVVTEDASAWSEAALARRLGEEAWRPFDLAAGPLVRVRLFRQAGDRWVVLLALHHLVADFASLAILARELPALYRQETGGPAAAPAAPGLRYTDFVRWQEEVLAGPRGARLWDYWRRRLAGLADLDLMADHPRPPVQTYRGGARAAAIPPALVEALREMGGRRDATLFMTLLAVFQAQLARYTGQEDFAVGAPVAGRAAPELGGLVGYLVNVLALRADVSSESGESGEPSFEVLLARTRRAALEGMEHGDLPFPRLAEGLRPVRDPARPPLFQVMLVLQQGRPQDPPGLAAFSLGEGGVRLDLAGLPLESVRLEERRSQVDLTLRLAGDGRSGLGVSLEHSSDLFDGGTAERMLGHFLSLLAAVAEAPETAVWHLPLLRAAERRQVMEEWNATVSDPSQDLLHQLFEAQAARTPEAAALVAGDLRLTYEELNARANRLAHHLRRLGVAPDDRVGICLSRSERMIEALFAVLKAGGAYVPLDPAYPLERLALIVADSAPRVVIGEYAMEGLAGAAGARWLSLDEASAEIAAESPEDPAPAADPDNLAYLIYTSGSTGKPKAVAVAHRSPVALMHWAREAFAPEELAGVLAATSIGFDVSVFEVFAPLSWGGRIVVAGSLLELPALLAAGEVTLLCGVPSVVAELVRGGRFPAGVRTVNLGGEAVPPALVEALAGAAPGARLLDLYGPSEDTVYSTFSRLAPGERVTIGVPVAGGRAYLLDARGEPVPVGVQGELFLAGAGLARGYLGRPELTAGRFVPDPFAAAPGSRLYRTGDLGRWLPEGVLEYLGRLDHQVKVRGFRVELGEVEAALGRHPGVREAAVTAREDGDRGARLVAYVAPAGVPAAELRGFLREILPESMVPSAFVGLDALPLSANGKVDRRALPDPVQVEAAPLAAFRSRDEERLAELIAEVLGIESAGPHDDFFALGGHSLLATRLLARVAREFGVELPVSAVFLHPTAAALAERLGTGPAAEAASPAPEPRAAAPRPPVPPAELPRTPAEQRLAAIWSEVLGVEPIGVHDDFFELGGHSLLAHRVAMRVAERLDVDVALGLFFEAPTLAEQALRIAEEGRPRGTAEERSGAPVEPPPIDSPPLALAQQRLWLLDRIEPGGSGYNVPVAVRLKGTLERGPLVRALAEIVRRHEPLRTVYALAGEEPVQVVLPPPGVADLPFTRLGLSGLPEPERQGALRSALRDAGLQPFDLARGPMARFLLVELDEGESVLLAAIHHIATDGWSASVFFRELAVLYGDFVAGRPASLPDLPMRYADWAVEQRRALASGVLDAQLGYWRRQLADLPVLELPTDRPRGVKAGEGGAVRPVEIPAELVAGFRVPGQGGITPFIVLLGGYLALLARLSGQDDLAVGIPAAGRHGLHTEDLIGFFVNTLVVRTRTGDDPGFAELLGRVRDAVLAAQAHQDVPLERLVEELQPERLPGVSPLFQVMFAYLANPLAPVRMPGLAVELLDGDVEVAKYDLTLSVYDDGGAPRAWLEYRTALLDPATADRWMGHLRTLLAGAAAEPSRPLSELPLLSPAERRQLLDAAAGPELEAGAAALLHELFERSAARAPGATALVMGSGGDELTYGELNARANRLARFLATLGAGPEVAVAVCLDRSPDMIVALLAVLKAGGAYVPLDPTYPPERLEHMLGDSGARVLVSRAGLPFRPAGQGDVRLVLLDADVSGIAVIAGIAAQEAHDLGTALAPANLAYVIYTSGSTGRPKGVEIPHGAAARHGEASRRFYGLTSDDRVLQVASMSFDTSIETIFATFAAGATLVFRGEEMWAGEELAARIAALDVTVADLPTPLFHAWVLDPRALAIVPPRLRLVETGGEEMLAEAARLWGRSALGGVRLLNGYGPTETVVTASQHEVDPAGLPVGLGRPMAERSLHVLDPRGAPQPLGVTGEIHLGGLMARGYRGRPDVTAASFVPDPFSEQPGARLYRSGDLARRRPDGDLSFLGRRDGQVKIRGFRVETGEVESALLAHPGVREAVVQAPTIGGERRLAAWIVPARPDEGVPDGLADFLRDRLPVYMVPAWFTVVAALPLTPAGKVDRRALPAPAVGEEEGEGRALGPLEELLAGLWRDLLGVGRVRAGDSFFTLGGHSLIATRLVSRVRSLFGVELPLAAVFDEPTLEGMTRGLAAALGEPGAAPAPPIRALPRDPSGTLLSFAQQRLWFLHGLDPESSAYNVPGALQLRGPLDTAALGAALAEIVRRHEALRTVFREGPNELVQVVVPPPASGLPVLDLGGLPEPARGTEALRVLEAGGRRPFDLEAGPLLRAELIRLGGEEHLLAVTMHHIVSDAWSLGVTFRELSELYGAFAAGRPSRLPELAVQYGDFARWQRSWLSGEVLARELDHWRRVLDGAPEALELPTDRPRPAPFPLAGQLPFALPAGLAAELGGLAQRRGWTLFMALLAVFDALLARWSGQRDLVVGAPIANRNRQEIEGLIGFFTNTLALRLDLSGDPSFDETARRVRAATLEAHAHQDLPFERLVEELAPERDLSRTPLFQAMLVLQHDPAAGLALPGLDAEMVDVPLGEAKFDLTLFLVEAGGGLAGHLEFNRGLFDPATGERLLGHFRTLIEGVVADPEARLSALPLLTRAERRELAAWTAPRNPHPAPRCVHEMVAAQAALTPDAEAVVFGPERLTYRGLVERAGRLAVRLRAAGVGPDVPVGLYLDRSLDMMVAVLGTLMAGGAYVPLDRSYPRERLRLMLEDAGAPVVLTHGPLAGSVPEGAATVLRVDEGPAEGPVERIDPGVVPGNLVYVTYTSGSTGRPKGVALTHAAITAMLAWQLRTSAAGAGRTLQYTSLSFDVSFQEIFATWCAGGTLVLVSEETRRDPVALVRLLAGERVERLFQPFVALQQLALAAADDTLPASLREVLSAGEQLHVTPQVAAMFARLPGASLYNHYGPSETHAATWLALHGDPALWPESPTVGRPLDHARVFLLDPDLQAVPVGVPGEIWVGGAGLARGYMRADLTAERFLPDPLDGSPGWQPGGRLYRTGDLARRRPDGELEFLGRRDAQVKVRGHRIETAEVELALARHPAVLQAAVAVRGDSAGARRLVAYVVFRDDARLPASGELRAFLAESLPDPMVPTAWARLDRLPMTPSGKLDRRSLARLHPEEPWGSDEGFVPPRDPVEELLAGIWSEVLGVERVGAFDDFFQLGGHSLLATQVASRVRRAFGIDLPLRRVFELPTPAALAEAVAAARQGAVLQAEQAPPPILPRGPEEVSPPLSFAQERLWFLHRLQPESPAYNIPLALRAEGPLDGPRLARALSEVARRHEVLRTVFAERTVGPVQVVLPPARVPLPAVDLGALPADRREPEARLIAAEEAARPFDLARGPLLRGLLVELSPGRRVVLLGFHHVVIDGWSLGVLVKEIKALYGGVALPELPVQYADFALWQRRWLSGGTLERQLAWWRERLQGAPATLDLAADHPRPPVMTQRGADHPFALGGGLSGDVAGLAHREGVTPFMVLAAGLFTLLGRLTGQREVTLGSPIANRHHRETEELIGFFVNTLVLRADLSRAATFRDLLRQVREESLEAYAHQDLPFEKLVDELRPERDLSRSSLFQVALALQNAPLPAADLGGVRLVGEEIPGGISKFDLSFIFTEGGDGRLAGVLQYATDLFEAPTAARWARHFTVLLAALVGAPEGSLAAAPLLLPEERHQILQEWNDARRDWPGDPALHQLFEAQADLQPDAIAGICEEKGITYGELERRANRLAHHLRGLGVGRSEPVAVALPRSLGLLAAVLGILKAGAVYMPLDPSWPDERVARVLAGTGARVVLRGEELAGFDGYPEHRPEAACGADDLAYLIHTSGSTGEPKGILVRHRSAVNTLRWNNETLGIGPGDRHLFVNSIGFDLSIYDLLGMLGAGAAVRVATGPELADPERLAAILRGGGITTWNSAPAALQRLAPFFPSPGEGKALRRVLLAGDWIPLSLPDLVRAAFPGAVIGNFGGATETSVWSNWHRVDEVDPAWAGIPYGRPIANARYYVLGPGLDPCPPGVPGDNYIGGGCLAAGYAGLPALTAERFLPDPYADEPGARMYTTGDRARFGPDGTLEFLGRVDAQVKVRGYRIELGEVEAALLRHRQVRAAVVLAREDVPGEQRLVAYVVPAAGEPAASVAELRSLLRETLPEYMVPWSFVELAALPVTANGKLDRDALPAPREARGEALYVAPRNDLERTVAAVWREVLELDRVGVEENFFEAGGSSLLLARLQGRLREALGREVPFVELFRNPTIESLARSLEGEAPAPEEKAGAARARTDTRRESMKQLQQMRGQRRGRKGER